ncbi:MAG: aminoacyl-tRNA hydrolase, partial [Candidatus Omnitrophica bacterium]|nr:aminoacyl-tRNA hydrolase [Candidatus Omnitrophota bacterium]
MKLIVGLGNPGLIYAFTRHNIGFQVIKSLARSLKIDLKRDRLIYSLAGKGKCAGQDIILAMPQTFMNLSGMAVKACFKKFKVTPADLLVICDDLDLDLGRIKIRPSGSSGGQRGLDSIIKQIGTPEFSRLRIGIGRPSRPIDAAKYVLTGFARKEKAAAEQ